MSPILRMTHKMMYNDYSGRMLYFLIKPPKIQRVRQTHNTCWVTKKTFNISVHSYFSSVPNVIFTHRVLYWKVRPEVVWLCFGCSDTVLTLYGHTASGSPTELTAAAYWRGVRLNRFTLLITGDSPYSAEVRCCYGAAAIPRLALLARHQSLCEFSYIRFLG